LAVMNPGRDGQKQSIRILQRFNMPAGSYGGFIQVFSKVSSLTITGKGEVQNPAGSGMGREAKKGD